MKMFRPINEFILIKRLEEPQEEGAGSKLVLPSTASVEFMYGKVLAVGDGALSPHGTRLPFSVKAGDMVYFKERGSEFLRDLEVYKSTERAVVGIIEDAAPSVPLA